MAERGEDPVLDTAAVHEDDRLLDELGRRTGEPSAGAPTPGDPVVALLVAWRQELDAAPVPARPTLDEAARALSGRRAVGRFRRGFVAASAAASVAGIALLGVGLGAHEAGPGDTLWGVSQALFKDHSRSVKAAANVTADLTEAERLLASGDTAQARAVLADAKVELSAVAPEDDQAALQRQHDELLQRLTTEPTDPAVPPTADPSVPGAPSSSVVPPVPPTVETAPAPASPVPGRTSVVPAPTVPRTTAPEPTTSAAPPTTTTEAPPSTTTAPTTSVPTDEPTVPPSSTELPTEPTSAAAPDAAAR